VRRAAIVLCTLLELGALPLVVDGSGAGTNLKVAGGHMRLQSAGKKFRRTLPLFGATSTISCFDDRFRGGQYSLVSFLFAVLLTVPPVPSHL